MKATSHSLRDMLTTALEKLHLMNKLHQVIPELLRECPLLWRQNSLGLDKKGNSTVKKGYKVRLMFLTCPHMISP